MAQERHRSRIEKLNVVQKVLSEVKKPEDPKEAFHLQNPAEDPVLKALELSEQKRKNKSQVFEEEIRKTQIQQILQRR